MIKLTGSKIFFFKDFEDFQQETEFVVLLNNLLFGIQ